MDDEWIDDGWRVIGQMSVLSVLVLLSAVRFMN